MLYQSFIYARCVYLLRNPTDATLHLLSCNLRICHIYHILLIIWCLEFSNTLQSHKYFSCTRSILTLLWPAIANSKSLLELANPPNDSVKLVHLCRCVRLLCVCLGEWLCMGDKSYCALFIAHAATKIEQTFPSNVEYCCHNPNIELKCTFSGDPVRVSWSFPVNGVAMRVTDNTPGHIVLSSNGALLLKVNDTVYSRNNTYRCTALYSDGEIVQSTPFVIPRDEG